MNSPTKKNIGTQRIVNKTTPLTVSPQKHLIGAKQNHSSARGEMPSYLVKAPNSSNVSRSDIHVVLKDKESGAKISLPKQKRSQEFVWIQEIKERISNLIGEWIALQGKRLISHGANFKTVKSQAKEKGFSDPLILFISEEGNIV